MKDFERLKKEILNVRKKHPEKYKRLYIGLQYIVSREFNADFELMAEARLEFKTLKMEEKRFLLSVMKAIENGKNS